MLSSFAQYDRCLFCFWQSIRLGSVRVCVCVRGNHNENIRRYLGRYSACDGLLISKKSTLNYRPSSWLPCAHTHTHTPFTLILSADVCKHYRFTHFIIKPYEHQTPNLIRKNFLLQIKIEMD